MLKIILIRPGMTDFDDQGRIEGTLNVPLNVLGTQQVARTVDELGELRGMPLRAVYCSPSQSAMETAKAVAAAHDLRPKSLPELRNLNQGLWHGKRIDEVRRLQPKVYRRWQENPESVCPPQGETIMTMRNRIEVALAKLRKKHKDGAIALVAPEPLASAIRSRIKETELPDLWKAECDSGGWELLEVAASLTH